MARKLAEVTWHENDVLLALENATEDVLERAAFRIEERAKLNIRSNEQIDTGFMWNSIYAFNRNSSNYGVTRPSGYYRSQKTGRQVKQDRAPEVGLPRQASAGVAAGAAYAAYQEAVRAFMWPALEATAEEVGGIVQEVAKQQGLRE